MMFSVLFLLILNWICKDYMSHNIVVLMDITFNFIDWLVVRFITIAQASYSNRILAQDIILK